MPARPLHTGCADESHPHNDRTGSGKTAAGRRGELAAVDADLILIGGGLANCLIALRLNQDRPDLKLLLLESDETLGGTHTWSFHGSDVSPTQLANLEELIEHAWLRTEIRFPDRRRTFTGTYHSITSARVNEVVADRLGAQVVCGARAAQVAPDRVELTDGRTFRAPGVIDGRGHAGNEALWVCYQKFLGRVVKLAEPHGLPGPILMDATVEQRDGFRFIYVLPFSEHRLLIEDTRYSDTAQLDHADCRTGIDRYIDAAGWRAGSVESEEHGVLPVVLGGDLDSFWAADPGVPRAGMRAGLFNPTTGYSLPAAAACADEVAAMADLSSPALYRALRRRSEQSWQRGRFLRLLNRMLFLAGPPERRYRVLEHFYRLPQATIERLYAGRLTGPDRLRILSGRPPVPLLPALRAMRATAPEPHS